MRPPRMMPGQEPYTEAEHAQLAALVADAAEGDPGELAEPARVERRYIIGSTTHPGYPIKSTRRAPVLNHEDYARFPTRDDGTGREHSFLYDVRRGVIRTSCRGAGPQTGRSSFVAKETDDPALVAQIDAAAARTAEALEAWRAAQRDERELLAVIAPRCKPARLR